MTKFLVGDIEAGGFGAMYARRKLIMQIAEAFQRVPVFRFTSYLYEDPFEPLQTTLTDIKKLGINEVKRFDFTENDEPVIYFDFNTYWGSQNMYKYQCWKPNEENYLTYSGKMYNSLKLKDTYKTQVDDIIQRLKEEYKINNFTNVVGLHFRRGDKIVESKYITEEQVLKYLKEKIDKATNLVFITSDELDYILYIIKKYPEINFIYDKEESRRGNAGLSNAALVSQNEQYKKEETLTFIKNVEILKQCSCVIGCYNVQMTKIAGSINSFLNAKDNLCLINPYTGGLEPMGNSLETS